MGFMKLGGMTLGSLVKKPETTLYPFETKPVPEGLKGSVVVQPDGCILCGICAKRCPCGAISVDKPGGTWSIDHFSCIQCGYCVSECPKQCLVMEPHYTAPASQKLPETIAIPR